jgi:DNA polymerase iota
VFLDVSDIIDYNVSLLNHAELPNSFFCLRQNDPTEGFAFDASSLEGHAYTPNHQGSTLADESSNPLLLRLILGSHLAYFMRMRMEQHLGYTATVGISTSKLLAKLVGNVNKPRGQTTLLPPYEHGEHGSPSNVTSFMDAHDISKVPDIGYKMSHKLREYALKARSKLDADALHIDEQRLSVGDLRNLPGVDARILEDILIGPGMQKGVGFRTWCLLHGIDDSDVTLAKDTPKQISIEDSYLRMDTFENVLKELLTLSTSLIRRMRTDLTEEEPYPAVAEHEKPSNRRWLAYPKTLRLSTRPRPPPGPDGRRGRASARISRSSFLPTFVFNLSGPIEVIAERLVHDCLLALFRQLHPEKFGWDLSLINVAVTNMAETAGSSRAAIGRDIGMMFKGQVKNLQPWQVEDKDTPPDERLDDMLVDDQTVIIEDMKNHAHTNGSEDVLPLSQESRLSVTGNDWYESDEDDQSSGICCPLCGSAMLDFALAAHLRFHETNN